MHIIKSIEYKHMYSVPHLKTQVFISFSIQWSHFDEHLKAPLCELILAGIFGSTPLF